MPPSFAPKERKRKREIGPPADLKNVDAIVDKIAREYREEMRRRGDVDIWGQPKQKLDKRKLKRKVEKDLRKDQTCQWHINTVVPHHSQQYYRLNFL